MTQAELLDKQVQYKAYPQSNITQNKDNDDDEDEDGKAKMGFKRKQKKSEEDENKVEEEEVKEGAIQIKPLFKFESQEHTEGR